MVIMGVDPGSVTTGYGILEKIGSRSTHLASGVVCLGKSSKQARRLRDVHNELDALIREYSPSVLVVESLFHGENVQSLIKLSQVRGVILLLGEMHGMEIFEYSPMEIKRGLTGYGRAEKEQMIFMVRKILQLRDLKSPDQADALAMALYHSHICRSCGVA